MKQRLRLAYFALLVAGCSPTAPNPSQLDDLRRNRELWESTQPAEYEFVLQRMCECVSPWSNPFRITVEARQIRSVVNDQTAETVPADSELVESIEELFALLEEALELGAHRVTAEYDPDFGYPTSIYIDHDEHMVDGETILSVRDLRPVD